MRAASWARHGCIALSLSGGLACGRAHDDQGAPLEPAPRPPVVPSASHAADQLAPGELLEGNAKAFGLSLPRDLRVDASFSDVVYASGRVGVAGVHPLVQYFEARLRDGGLREGQDAATFEHVHISEGTEREYEVRIYLHEGEAHVELRDTTPPPAPVLPDESARWRQVGLTPHGRLADPTHLD